MKHLLYTLSIILGMLNSPSIVYGQKVTGNGKIVTQTREVGDFTKISALGSMDVILEKGDKSTVEVIAEENIQDLILVSVEKKTLVVRVKPGAGIKTKGKIEVHIFKSKPDEIRLEGSGSIKGAGKLDLKALKVSLEGSGNVNLNVDASTMKMQVNGSGEMNIEGGFGTIETLLKGSGTITLKGQAKLLKATTNGSGELKAASLTCNTVIIKASGSGNIRVHATQSLEVESTGSGDITFIGSPASRKVNIKGKGKCSAAGN